MLFRNEKLRPLLAILCALGWSLAYPFIKLGYGELQIDSADLGSKILFAGIRFFAAGLLVLAFSAVQKRKLAVTRKEVPWLTLFALVNTALHYLFSYIGLSYIPSARSTILDSMGSFFLIILSGLFLEDDTFSVKKIAGCLLGFCGILTISITPGGGLFSGISFLGDGMILLNACCAAGGGILTRFISKKMDMMTATGYGMSAGGLMLLLVGLMVGVRQPWNLSLWGVTILFVLVLISAVCFGIYNMLLANHPISKVAIYNSLIPVFGVMFSSLLLREPFSWQYILAAGLTAAGVYVVNRK
ncbi:MAG: DMT family transporter [Clostridiales bacterium]|nr:DMT family transporter [Clostridiales bacterium]MCI7574366.1 DMT family transporter [Clostridiales bacterium]